MDAPEKIYIPTILAANTVRYKAEGSIEYTRTDTFVEKAAEWIKNKAENYIVDTPLCSFFDYKRAIEDFKDYMKGK